MSENELLATIADEYRSQGYDILLGPTRDQLPDFLKDEGADVIASKGAEHVAVQVKRRDQLYDLRPTAEEPPGWRVDLIVYPPNRSDELPRNGAQETPEYTALLIDEAENL